MAGGVHSVGFAGSSHGDYRSGGPQDGHQRVEFRREGVHGGFRRCNFADVEQPDRGPGQSAAMPCGGRFRSASPEGKQYELNEQTATLMVRPRGWHLTGKAPCGGWQADFRQPVRFRTVLLSQRARTAAARQRTVFLSAQDGEPSGSATLERCFQLRAGCAGRFRAARFGPRC